MRCQSLAGKRLMNLDAFVHMPKIKASLTRCESVPPQKYPPVMRELASRTFSEFNAPLWINDVQKRFVSVVIDFL